MFACAENLIVSRDEAVHSHGCLHCETYDWQGVVFKDKIYFTVPHRDPFGKFAPGATEYHPVCLPENSAVVQTSDPEFSSLVKRLIKPHTWSSSSILCHDDLADPHHRWCTTWVPASLQHRTSEPGKKQVHGGNIIAQDIEAISAQRQTFHLQTTGCVLLCSVDLDEQVSMATVIADSLRSYIMCLWNRCNAHFADCFGLKAARWKNVMRDH